MGNIIYGQDLLCVTPAKPRGTLFFLSIFFCLVSYITTCLLAFIHSLDMFMVLWALGPVEIAVNKANLVPALEADRQHAFWRKQ